NCERVLGIEWNELAVERARACAKPNEEYLCANVDDVLARVLEEIRPETLVLDPPAIGLKKYAALLQHPPRHLIYVSCNPTTLARDISRLNQQFRIQSIQPFDMFPQTAGIEVVVSMRSVEDDSAGI
ncbi:MAG: 23S rRNA (uracil(1939)-C(5))-methyltransferase RlmD, partial [Verrucomicrobia bacterium]|nr:23S rRNA (uracil(1939)-C(5))-methyltransferase RlmD [Verrucomicrobiota bacterium]